MEGGRKEGGRKEGGRKEGGRKEGGNKRRKAKIERKNEMKIERKER